MTDMMLSAMAVTPEAEPAAIYSRSLTDAESFREEHQLKYACADLDELGRYDGIDAVYIASPNGCHYEQAKRMLEHGKHVLCEKPACASPDQVRELIALAEAKGLVFLEAMRPVFSDGLRTVRENLPKIGKLRQISITYCKPSSRYPRFLEGKYVNTFNPALANAAIMDLGCYGIHSVVHLFGKPEFISAQAVHLDNGFEAAGTVLMHYPEFTANVTYSKIHRVALPSVFAGEEGSVWMNSVNNTERVWFETNKGERTDLGYQIPHPNDMGFELRAFDRFITEGIRPVKENEDSVITAEIISEACRQTGTRFEGA